MCCCQLWLQEFAWTEAEKAERLEVRSSGAQASSQRAKSELKKEPMFCFETAMNMLYWSALVYDYEEVGKPSVFTLCSPDNPLHSVGLLRVVELWGGPKGCVTGGYMRLVYELCMAMGR